MVLGINHWQGTRRLVSGRLEFLGQPARGIGSREGGYGVSEVFLSLSHAIRGSARDDAKDIDVADVGSWAIDLNVTVSRGRLAEHLWARTGRGSRTPRNTRPFTIEEIFDGSKRVPQALGAAPSLVAMSLEEQSKAEGSRSETSNPSRLSLHDKNGNCSPKHGEWVMANDTSKTQTVIWEGMKFASLPPSAGIGICATPGEFVFTLKSSPHAKLTVTISEN